MLLFAHTGLTAGMAVLLEKSAARSAAGSVLKFDYRLVLVGSVLPDIIDKPLGLIILGSSLGNSRIFGHTLLLTLLLTTFGIILKRNSGSLGLLTIAGGSFVHLMLDQMWLQPQTLCWPALGVPFPPRNAETWLANVITNGFTDTAVYVPEMIGAAIVIVVGLRILESGGVKNFLKRGKLP